MDLFTFRLAEIPIRHDSCRREVETFLGRHDLKLDDLLQRYFGVYKGEQLVGGAGYYGNVIKCVAVEADYRGEGIINALISHIIAELYQEGITAHFLFTKPENEFLFENLSFSTVEATHDVLLMESPRGAFAQYLNGLASFRKKGKIGALVMNCNPFTLGHQYLIEQASEYCDQLIIFVVEEDASVFPFPTRYRLVQEGVAHLPSVTVTPGGPYIISAATFPTYFIANQDDIVSAHAELDIKIFAKHICPAVGIVGRFVGEEPYSQVTRIYNETMLRDLPKYGIDITVFPRKHQDGDAISASRVRKLLAEGNLAQVRELVPDTTYRFLLSDEATTIIQKLRAI